MLEIKVSELVCCYGKRNKHGESGYSVIEERITVGEEIPRFQVVRPPTIQENIEV